MNRSKLQWGWLWTLLAWWTKACEPRRFNNVGQARVALLALVLLNGGLALVWRVCGTHPFLAVLEVLVINVTLIKVLPAWESWLTEHLFRSPRPAV